MPSNTAPSVSVALCTHNGERFVGRQVESILAQRPPITELVVSDDASSDRTVELVEEVVRRSGQDVRLRILRNETPLGVVANFEQALSACTERYIALSDQDDIWHPERLARILALFEADERVMLVHTDARLIDANAAPLGATLFDALEISPQTIAVENEGDALGLLLRRNLVTGATAVLTKDLVEAARPFPPEWVHDEWLAVCAATTRSLRCLPSVSIDYRQHGGNQIGVARPTLGYKLRRMLEPGRQRQQRLAAQFARLAERSGDISGLGAEDRKRIAAKARFEETRAGFPRRRLKRIVPVLRLAATGGYSRFASQGRRDVARDLLRAD